DLGPAADQDGQHRGAEGSQLRHHSVLGARERNGRTSIHSCSERPPRAGADDSSAAIWWARSRDSTSMIIHPATTSLVSANGPSVTGALPSPSYRTKVPSGDNAWASTNSPLSVSEVARSDMNPRCASTSSGAHCSICPLSHTGSGPPR